MSSLRERIEADVREAMRARDRERLGTLRLITAALKQREVDTRRPVDDEGVLEVLGRMVKQRRDSIAQFQAGGRPELAEREAAEIGVIEQYLPPKLSEEELATLLEEAIAQTGASGPRDMGKVMGALRARVQGRTDMGALSRRVKQRLAGAA